MVDTQTPTNPDQHPANPQITVKVGAMVGGVPGGNFLLALIAFAFWFVHRKQNLKKKPVQIDEIYPKSELPTNDGTRDCYSPLSSPLADMSSADAPQKRPTPPAVELNSTMQASRLGTLGARQTSTVAWVSNRSAV